MASTRFQFVISSTDGGNDADGRRAVRAHAARNVHVRRRRVAEYQSLRQGRSPNAGPADCSLSQRAPGQAERLHLVPRFRSYATLPAPSDTLGVTTPDPFDSFHRILAPLEQLFLDYFFRHVVTHDFSNLPCDGRISQGSFILDLKHETGVAWTQAALADPGMLASIFLVSCRSLSQAQSGQGWDRFALGYKIQALRELQNSISREGNAVTEITITKTLAMASEEFFSGDPDAADSHLKAAAHMVRLRTVPHALAMWKHDKNNFLWTHSEERVNPGQSIGLTQVDAATER